MFKGRVDLALASYNAGEGRVLDYGNRVPPFRETREYVKKISARYRNQKAPESTKMKAPAPTSIDREEITMKAALLNRISLFALLLAVSCSYVVAQSDRDTPLTNTAVVKLVKAGFKDKTIINIIASRPAKFDLSTDRMIELKKSGVSEKLIMAMLSRQEGSEFSDDLWSDEAFISGNGDSSQKSTQSPNGGSLDIFGSSGGSKGTTKHAVQTATSSGDIVTTGSATVRILRPPSEAGGAPPKLEKTPSLTNDTVIELVEAGFSEGTIVRRIEQSPVAFDFSPEKLAELRRHRVSEKIMMAMKAAMGINASPDNTPPRTGNVTPKQ